MSAQAAEPRVLSAGEMLAPGYRIVQHISRGEALDVYEVFSVERLCSCVAKTVRPDRAHVQRVRDRLVQEGGLLGALSHPHLLRGFDTLDGDVPVVVTETLPGLTLEELIELRQRRLPAADVAHLGQQLCSAAQFLHAHGTLHLDIRPANIVVSGGRCVLIDLSLARPPGAAPRGVGTREHMSPEQARGDDLTAAADVWGIGVCLYEAVTGQPAFAVAEGAPERGYLQLQRRAVPVERLRRGLPRALVSAIHSALEVLPADRPSPRQLWQSLGDVLSAD